MTATADRETRGLTALARVPGYVSALAAFVGAATLLLYALGAHGVTRSGPLVPAPNTAAAFLLFAGALWTMPTRGRRPSAAFLALCTLAGLIGLLTVLEYVFGANLIDTLLGAPAEAKFRGHPGRIALNTSVCVALLALALVLLAYGRTRLASAGLLIVIVIAFTALLGYAVDVRALAAVGRYAKMSVTTGLALVILAVGAVCTRPEEGLAGRFSSPTPGGQALRRLVPVAVLAPTLAGAIRYAGDRAGWWSDEVGVWLFTVAIVIAGVALIIVYARSLDAAEHERRRAAEELEQRSRDLERSNAELEQFAYIASHDLAEPLRAISGFSELLDRNYREQLDERADEYLRFIVGGTRRMQAMIDGLLALSRAGRSSLDRRAIDLGEVVDRAWTVLRASVREAGADLQHDRLPVVDADPVALGQILQNLLSNALKFRAEGRAPRVSVAAVRAGTAWRVSVSDDGIGMDPAQADRVFRMFQRLHTRTEYEGTGIGLALVRRLVERHGGRVWIESAPGEGATFFFTLPDSSPFVAG